MYLGGAGRRDRKGRDEVEDLRPNSAFKSVPTREGVGLVSGGGLGSGEEGMGEHQEGALMSCGERGGDRRSRYDCPVPRRY